MLVVTSRILIPDEELRFSFARSGGPGGQNVNKVNSKAVLHWSAEATRSLPVDVHARFLAKFRSRITNEGEIVIASQRYRDQPKNIEDCLEKLKAMIGEVLVAPKKRRPTKPTKGSQQRRLQDKKRDSQTKSGRRSVSRDE